LVQVQDNTSLTLSLVRTSFPFLSAGDAEQLSKAAPDCRADIWPAETTDIWPTSICGHLADVDLRTSGPVTRARGHLAKRLCAEPAATKYPKSVVHWD